jgi:chorismate lyase / 3-hydroxybenzoate synthase
MAAVESAVSGLRVEFHRRDHWVLDEDVLAALVYGASPPAIDDARIIHVGLATADGRPAVEFWRSSGPATTGVSGPIRWAIQGDFLFGCLEVHEREFGGMLAAAEAAYRTLLEFQQRQPQRHLLRIWNHLHAINDGDGDLERYRQFCIGRARGLGDMKHGHLPAGTAVGRRDRAELLQICWLAGRQPGRPVGNPRQIHAYEYPRQYGPTPPSFSRAMLLPNDELIGSGTASIVGHESLHGGNLEAQIDETLTNLRELCRAGDRMIAHSPRADRSDTAVAVKVYLRSSDTATAAASRIQAGLAGSKNLLLLEAEICRRELLVEIECTWA